MSGEAVLIPLVWESITGIAGAVNHAIDARKDAARHEAEKERERIRVWQDFQTQQGAQQQRLQRSREVLRQAHQHLLTIGLNAAATRDLGGPTSEGFVDDTRAENHCVGTVDLLQQISKKLDEIPDELYRDERLPFTRLRSHLHRLQQASAPIMDEIHSFRDTLNRTLADTITRISQEAEQHQILFDNAMGLMTDILQTRALSLDQKHDEDLEKLQRQLLAQIKDKRISLATMDIVATRFHALRDKVHRDVNQAEMGNFLLQRVTHHLNAMGYARLDNNITGQPGRQRDAEFALPQGDRLRVALQPDLRMAFQLTHETEVMLEKTLAGEALEFFRQQEARWCRDMKDLIRRLVKDGVPYEVQFEREMPQESIPIVVVETADELLDEEHDVRRRHEGKRQRHFT